MIVLVGGEKGGVGKTTLAVNLAAMRRRAGHDVLLIDADKQASANLWAGIRQEETPRCARALRAKKRQRISDRYPGSQHPL